MSGFLTLIAATAVARPVAIPVGVQGGAWVEALDRVSTVLADHDDLDRLLEEAAGRAPAGVRGVEVHGVDSLGRLVPLQQLLPDLPPVPDKEPRFRSLPVDHPGAVDGALSGKAVYVSQCHGWMWYDSLGRFSTQRGILFDTVEDFHNPEGANQYLVRYLENMGARVFTAKERDIQPLMAIADNDGVGYTESGAGFADGAPGFAQPAAIPYGVDPFDEGTTRTFPADGGGVATWTPDVPADGHYAVYVSWDSDIAHATDAHYRITHPGGVIDRRYDQTVHGSTWQYVETLWLTAGASLTVELVGDSTQAGKLLSADAVRVGGGMTEVTRHGQNPNRPRWETGALQYTQYNGAPTSVYDPSGDGLSAEGGSDPSSRSRWADWEHPAGEDAVYLSWHSNAASSTARGTVTYWAGTQCSAAAITGSGDLAEVVQDELIGSFHALWDPSWSDRGTNTACFSEVSPSNNDEMPAVLVELAFHDNADDAAHLKDPLYRQDASRAMARGIARYFAERDGEGVVFPPEPPVGVQLLHEGGELVARWQAGDVGAPFGDAPTQYRLYRSRDGRAWDNGTDVSDTEAVVDADPGELVFVRVAALNDGGISFPSELVGARRSPQGAADVLVVAAFDRLDAGLLDRQYKDPIGTTTVFDVQRTNAFDIVRAHGQAIADAGYTFDAASDEAAAGLDLADYAVVVWATGEESTADETFSRSQQEAVTAFVDGGGVLWVSGAEVFWDLDARGDDDDRAFALDVLGAGMAADASVSGVVEGEGILAGLRLDFGSSAGGPYPVEYADVLASGRTVVARYDDGAIAGVVGSGVATFGFPLDAVVDAAALAEAFRALLEELSPQLVPIGATPTDPGTTDPGTDPGTTDTPTDPTGDDDDDGTALTGGDAPVAPEKKGCGCGTEAPSGVGGALLVLLALRRRR